MDNVYSEEKKTPKIKILQVARDAGDTGGGRVVLETSNKMATSNVDIKLLTDVEIPSNKLGSIDIIVTPFGKTLKKWSPKTKLFKTIRHFLQILFFTLFGTIYAKYLSKKGWIVLNHNIEIYGGDILILHNVFSAEYVQDPRSSFQRRKRWLNPVFVFRIIRERLMLLKPNNIVCAVSAATAKEAESYINKTTKLMHINNGVNIDMFTPLQKDNINKDKFVLLFIGHEFERKGLEYIIKALPLLPEHVCLWVVGGRMSNQSHYEKLSEKLDVSQRTQFFGTHLDTIGFYQNADLFVLPSVYETWALVGLEAMACGTPALIPSVGGVPEYLKDGVNGYFIERDHIDIANKIKIILTQPDLLMNMRKAARETALQHSWDSVADKYLSLVKDVVKEKSLRA